MSSVFRHERGWAVYAVEGEIARLHPVELGERNGRVARVTKGLSAGQSVIVHPSDRIAEGIEVSVR